MVLPLALAGARAGIPAEALSEARSAFDKRVEQAVYTVIPYDPDGFRLTGPSSAIVVLYHNNITCRDNVSFKLNAGSSKLGSIGVSVCPEHADRLRMLATDAARELDGIVADFAMALPPASVAQMRQLRSYYDRSARPGGGEVTYFVLIVVGRPGMGIPTLIAVTDDQAVVLQIFTSSLCADPGNPVPLCADAKATLSAIAQRLLK